MRRIITDDCHKKQSLSNRIKQLNRLKQLGFKLVYSENLESYKDKYTCVHTLPDNLFDSVDLFDTSEITDDNNLLLYFSREDLEKIKEVDDQYLKAAVIVRRVFANVLDKAGSPYLNHLYAVSLSEDYISSVAGLLHDIIEDTNITALDLLELGIDKEIVETVFIVTKPLKEKTELSEEERLQSYNEEIDSIIDSGNSHALKLKVRDMKNNYDPKRLELLPSKKREWFDKKYGNNLKKLEKVLESRNKDDRY